MRSFLKAAAWWQAATASAFIIPPETHQTVSNDISTVAGTIGPDVVSIQFQSPCPGCFVGTDDGLELELSVGQSFEECRVNDISLNGLPLVPAWIDDVAQGDVVFKSRLSNGLGEREMLASWQLTCLDDEASMLSVNIHNIMGLDDVKEPTGFTASFRQRHEPTILRLQTTPTDMSRTDGLVGQWLHPDDSHRLVITLPMYENDAGTDLEQEFIKLEELKLEMHELGRQLQHQEGKILHMMKQDFRTCNSMKCLLQTAMRKIPDFTQLLKSHFRHHPKAGTVLGGSSRLNCSRGLPFDKLAMEEAPSDEFNEMLDMMEHPPLPLPPGSERPHPHPPFEDRPRPPFREDRPHPPSHGHPPFDENHPHPPFDGRPPFDEDHPRPPFDGPPPFGKDHPHPPFDGPPPFGGPHHRPPPPPGTHGHPASIHSPFGHHRRHFVKGAVVVVVFILVAALLFRHLRNNTKLFRNPRRSVERAARREERQNRREYQRAARRHRWSQWWNRYRRPCSSSDYEEKRSLIVQQEDVLENDMQGEIRNLRTAHEIVGELMRAEEGRARLYYEANLPPSQRPVGTAAELEAGVGPSRTNSLPLYASPPPQYEEELEGDITVVDGFRYTPSATDTTPDSSVVDCSPRLSFETGRTTLARESRE